MIVFFTPALSTTFNATAMESIGEMSLKDLRIFVGNLQYVTFALVFSDMNNRVTVVWVKATESSPQPSVCDMTGSLLHHRVTHCWIIALEIRVLLFNVISGIPGSKEKPQLTCIKRKNKKEKEKQITVQSVHQSQHYKCISDVGRTMKDLDEKQSRSAQMIDTRGWPVCVVSYWCINYIQESCPNTSHTIYRFSSQQERERAGLRLIIGLSPNISEIQAKTLNVGGWGTQLWKIWRLLQPSRWWRESLDMVLNFLMAAVSNKMYVWRATVS